MRRLICLLLLLSGPAHAWTFTPLPVCTLSHTEAGLDVVVTFDPRQEAPYAITVTGPDPWPEAAFFGIEFRGTLDLTITTPSHGLSEDRRTLTVTDRGFGNVLDGLEFNAVASLFTGAARKDISLSGAAMPVRDFRSCSAQPAV